MPAPLAHVLVIDDSEPIRSLVREQLELDGHRVTAVPDGASALALLDRTAPDLVILDVDMPGMDGLAVLARIKARRPGLPVLLFTAVHGVEDEAFRRGAAACLPKAAGLDELRRWTLRCCPPQPRGSGR